METEIDFLQVDCISLEEDGLMGQNELTAWEAVNVSSSHCTDRESLISSDALTKLKPSSDQATLDIHRNCKDSCYDSNDSKANNFEDGDNVLEEQYNNGDIKTAFSSENSLIADYFVVTLSSTPTNHCSTTCNSAETNSDYADHSKYIEALLDDYISIGDTTSVVGDFGDGVDRGDGKGSSIGFPTISFMDFQVGSIALFVPNDARKLTWMAYNENKPNYFLSQQSLQAVAERSRVHTLSTILGRIVYMESHTAEDCSTTTSTSTTSSFVRSRPYLSTQQRHNMQSTIDAAAAAMQVNTRHNNSRSAAAAATVAVAAKLSIAVPPAAVAVSTRVNSGRSRSSVLNPYNLPVGTVYFICHVELLTSAP